MDRDQSNRPGDRSGQFLQVDLTPRQRKISSPYPLYHFKKPGDYHPSYQTPPYHPQPYPTDDQPPHHRSNSHHHHHQPQTHEPSYPPQPRPAEYPPEEDLPTAQPEADRSRGTAGGSPPPRRAREARPAQLKRAASGDRGSNRGKPPRDPQGRARAVPTLQNSSGRPRAGDPPDNQPPVGQRPDHLDDDPEDSLDSILDLQQGQGLLTDDDKLNESEKDRKPERSADGGSDDEAERGLEMLRQLHERSEAERRLEESRDVREDPGDDKADRASPRRHGLPRRRRSDDELAGDRLSPESGSDTPTDSRHYPHPSYPPDHPPAYPGESTPLPHPDTPVTLLPPADVEVYYSLSKRRYHVAPSVSDSSFSRDLSPRSWDPESSRTASRLQSVADDPEDRATRRATRADVLNRAESLLHSRLRSRLESPRYRDGRGNPHRSAASRRRRRKPGQPGTRRQLQRIRETSGVRTQVVRKFSDTKPPVKRVAFVDVEDEGNDDNDARGAEDEGRGPSLGRSFRETERETEGRGAGMTSALTSFGDVGGGRQGEESAGRVGNSHRQYSNSRRRPSDVIFPVRRPVKRAGRPKKLGLRVSQEAQLFSGSEEGDTAHYGLRDYSDPARYQLTPALPPLSLSSPPSSLRNDWDQGPGQGDKKARRVWFFRNGDQDFKARLVVVSKKLYPNLETLLVALENVVPTVAGVKHIFSLPEGRKVWSVRELQDGCYYVCSSVNRLADVKYGDVREQSWRGGKVAHDESHLFAAPHDMRPEIQSPQQQQQLQPFHHQGGGGVSGWGGGGGGGVRPLVLTLISNLQRESQEKLILNPHTAMGFEALLDDLQNMVHLPFPPATALYTVSKPYIKVEGFSHLFHKLKDHRTFLVCGEERVPLDPSSSHPSLPRVKGKRPQRPDKHLREMRKGMTGRRGRTEAVHCQINGKKRGESGRCFPMWTDR